MVSTKKASNHMVVQGGILASASLIVRLIGFFYRIPLVNILGEEGMGYYSSSFEIYSFMLIISSYALPAALSKIISKKITLRKYKEAHQIFKAGLLLGAFVGLITSSIMYFQAQNLASLIGSPGSVHAMRALAPALLIFSILAVFRGYFQGMNTMVPTAISQIIEQVFNAIFSLVMAYALLSQGVAFGAAGGTLGTGIGTLFGLLFLIFVYRMARPYFGKRMASDRVSTVEDGLFDYWQIIVMTSVPMLIGSTAYNLSGLVDTVLFQRGLLFQGYEPAFVAGQYGILASKYKLILTLPISVASALAAASIPGITSLMAKKEYAAVQHRGKQAIKMVLLVSIPSAFGLAFLAEPILLMLFGAKNIEIASLLMRLGAMTVIFYSVSAICIGILQGLGMIRVPVHHSLVALGVKVVFMIILIYVFDFGLIGAVLSNIIFSGLVATMNYLSIEKKIHLNMDYRVSVMYPLIAGLMMGIVAMVVHMMVMAMSNSNVIGTLTAIMIGGLFYVILLIKIGGITEAELLIFPKGNRLVALAKRLRLM
ncbi:MAG: polysaccharide biosynthesis protein [Vallitaleaceae bacterium]|nr:polysaccharide biosynthesis protein [Vallitaleaceae bacterium]